MESTPFFDPRILLSFNCFFIAKPIKKMAIGGIKDSNMLPIVEDVRPCLERAIYMSVKHIAKPTRHRYVIVRRNNLHTILHFFLRFCKEYMQHATYTVDTSMTRYIKGRAARVCHGARAIKKAATINPDPSR